jgi:hypothetical protein
MRRELAGAIALTCLSGFAVSTPAADRPRQVQDILGPAFHTATGRTGGFHRPRPSSSPADTLRYWNTVAVDASGLDHTPLQPGETGRVFGEQFGPGRSSRALAIVHIAIFDALNANNGGYRSYSGIRSARQPASDAAAIAVAAHDTLVAMFPSQRPAFDGLLAEALGQVRDRDPRAKTNGMDAGRRAAAAILALRAEDGGDLQRS